MTGPGKPPRGDYPPRPRHNGGLSFPFPPLPPPRTRTGLFTPVRAGDSRDRPSSPLSRGQTPCVRHRVPSVGTPGRPPCRPLHPLTFSVLLPPLQLSLCPTPGVGPGRAPWGRGSRAGPSRTHGGCTRRGHPRARLQGSQGEGSAVGTTRPRAARGRGRPVAPGTDRHGQRPERNGERGLRTGTGTSAAPAARGPVPTLPKLGVPGRRPWAVPGLWSPVSPGCPGTLPLPCARGYPGRSRHSTPPCARGCPGRSRAIPGPRSLRAPGAVPGSPGLFRDLLLRASGAVPAVPASPRRCR